MEYASHGHAADVGARILRRSLEQGSPTLTASMLAGINEARARSGLQPVKAPEGSPLARCMIARARALDVLIRCEEQDERLRRAGRLT